VFRFRSVSVSVSVGSVFRFLCLRSVLFRFRFSSAPYSGSGSGLCLCLLSVFSVLCLGPRAAGVSAVFLFKHYFGGFCECRSDTFPLLLQLVAI
jgi:hypothetical protein